MTLIIGTIIAAGAGQMLVVKVSSDLIQNSLRCMEEEEEEAAAYFIKGSGFREIYESWFAS